MYGELGYDPWYWYICCCCCCCEWWKGDACGIQFGLTGWNGLVAPLRSFSRPLPLPPRPPRPRSRRRRREPSSVVAGPELGVRVVPSRLLLLL